MPQPSKSRSQQGKIQITKRDLDVFRALREYGVLSTEQIVRLLFSSESRARRRLRQLWQHSLIKRQVRPIRMGEGSSSFFYTLTQRAGSLIPESMKEESTGRLRAIRPGNHLIRLNDFRITLHKAGEAVGDGFRLHFKSGANVRFRAQVTRGGRSVDLRMIPDGFVGLETGGKQFWYFIEIDLGTEDQKRIRTKMLAYLSAFRDGEVARRLGIRSFRVLCVTTTEKRLANMTDELTKLRSLGLRTDVVFLSSFDKIKPLFPETLLDRIWLTVDSNGTKIEVSPFLGHSPLSLPTAPGKPPVRGPDA